MFVQCQGREMYWLQRNTQYCQGNSKTRELYRNYTGDQEHQPDEDGNRHQAIFPEKISVAKHNNHILLILRQECKIISVIKRKENSQVFFSPTPSQFADILFNFNSILNLIFIYCLNLILGVLSQSLVSNAILRHQLTAFYKVDSFQILLLVRFLTNSCVSAFSIDPSRPVVMNLGRGGRSLFQSKFT